MLNRLTPDSVAPPRAVVCPDCRHMLPLVRQLPPFEIACRRCLRLVRVTGEGISRGPGGRGLRSRTFPPSPRFRPGPDRSGPSGPLEDRTVEPAPRSGPRRRRIRRVGSILSALLTAAGAIAWIALLIVAFQAPHPPGRFLFDRTATQGLSGTVDHEVGLRREAVRRYDRYLERSGHDPDRQELWQELRRRELEAIGRLEQYASTRRAASSPAAVRPFLDR